LVDYISAAIYCELFTTLQSISAWHISDTFLFMCRTFRLAAYRQFTWWTHKRLGRRIRRAIPSCVVVAIRKKFPDEQGHYVGHREVDEHENAAYPD